MIKKYCKLAVVVILMIALAGCATIIHGGRQNISIKSNPGGATVTVNKVTVTTPGVIKLSRFEPRMVLRFKKEGYKPAEVILARAVDGWLFGNVLIGGLIGIAIDFATGAAYQLTPKEVNVTLRPLGRGENKISYSKETPIEKEEIEESPGDERVVAVDVLSRPSSYSEYYRIIYKAISKKVTMPKDAPGGAVNVGITILSDGTLQKVEILENSSEETALREAVLKAVKDSAPFPPFPEDIKEGRKAFTIMIEFRQNR